MNRQKACDVLNSLKVIESDGGSMPYILVENSYENRKALNDIGVSDERINAVMSFDNDSFCILALAFYDDNPLVDDYVNGKFVIWNPLVDDELRNRVVNGEGTASDAMRLLKALEPQSFYVSQ